MVMKANDYPPLTDSDEKHVYRTLGSEGFWELDRNLPRWARRSNPIVRRHLGGFFGAPIPQPDVLIRLFLAQALIILFSFLFPPILEIAALMGLVSFIVLPIALGVYAWALFRIGRATVNAIIDEKHTRALDTLRTTPLSLRSILLSKIAAGLWLQAVNLDTIILAVAVFSLPPVTIEYATLYPPERFPLETRLLIFLGLGATMVRIFVEPLMIGALGLLVGTVSGLRLTAIMWTTLLGAAYFTLLNLPRLFHLTLIERLAIEIILPVALPVVISVVALVLTKALLQRD
jgi:hypothetical protein